MAIPALLSLSFSGVRVVLLIPLLFCLLGKFPSTESLTLDVEVLKLPPAERKEEVERRFRFHLRQEVAECKSVFFRKTFMLLFLFYPGISAILLKVVCLEGSPVRWASILW